MHDKEKRNTANVNEDIHILMTCVRNSPKLHESPLQFCLNIIFKGKLEIKYMCISIQFSLLGI
jgi:hypothetical protein